jgi:hypothetical protein
MSPERRASGRRVATTWTDDLRAPRTAQRGRHGRRGNGGNPQALPDALGTVARLARRLVGTPGQDLTGHAWLRRWAGVAAGAWALVALYTYLVAPHGALGLAGGFALLYVALAATLVPLCRLVGGRLVPRALRAQVPFSHAVRQGLLLALLVTANLALLAGRAWSPVALIVGLIAFGIAEAVTLARK